MKSGNREIVIEGQNRYIPRKSVQAGMPAYCKTRAPGMSDRLWKAPGVTQCGPLHYAKCVAFFSSSDGRMRGWRHCKSGIPLSRGRREREARLSLLHSLSVQRIQPNIKFIFSPHLVGLVTWAMQQSETPETKQKPGIFTPGIGKSGYF